MKKLNFTFLLVFFIKTLAFGQIGKGVYTFSPDFSVSTRAAIRGTQTSFTPSFGIFLGSKILLEGQVSTNTTQFLSNYNERTLFGHIKARYYYLDMGKWKAYFSAGFGLGKNNLQLFSGNVGNAVVNETTYFVNKQIATGTNYFLNKNVALDANIGYATSIDNQKAGTYIKRKNASIDFVIDFKPFLDIASIKESKETTDFLHEGKIMLAGHLGASVIKNSQIKTVTYKTATVDVNIDYFLSKHIAVGSNIYYENFSRSNSYRAGLSASYFFHSKKRSYFTPSIKSDIYYQGHGTFSPFRFVHTPNINFYYFFNQNIALNVGLNYQFEVGSKLVTVNLNKLYFNTGLKYFIN